MTYRSTLAALVTRVRELIDDTGTPTWSNDQIAAALDQNRVSHNNEKLRSEQAILRSKHSAREWSRTTQELTRN